MVFADSHAHLGSVAEELGEPALRGVLAAYEEAWAPAAGEGGESGGLPLLVDIGTDPGDLARRRAALLGAELQPGRRPFLRLSAGVWPSAEALADPRAALAGLEASMALDEASGGRCAAIGECGLDYHHMNGSREAQLELFEGQAEMARRRGLGLVVHSRDAFEDSRGLLAAAALAGPVVIHCFGYGPAEARAFLDLGCYVSFAGNLTYRKAGALREACALVPADRLLLETDAPYMNPEPRRGRPCTSLDVERTYEAAAAVRGAALAELALAVAANARKVFG